MLLTVKADSISEVEPGNEPVSDGVHTISGVTGFFESQKQKVLHALENIYKIFPLFIPPSPGSWYSSFSMNSLRRVSAGLGKDPLQKRKILLKTQDNWKHCCSVCVWCGLAIFFLCLDTSNVIIFQNDNESIQFLCTSLFLRAWWTTKNPGINCGRYYKLGCVYMLKCLQPAYMFLKRCKIPWSNISFNNQINVNALFIFKTSAGKSSPEKSQH